MDPRPAWTRDDFEAAAERIRSVLVRTPLVPLRPAGPEDRAAEGVLLKPEIHQAVGSFKLRGVHHAVLSFAEEERARGLSTVSAGNTAQALAWSARRFGVEARSLMPEGAPATKVEAVRALGGTPVLVPTAEVFRFLRERGWEDEPYAFVHPWTSEAVMLGHGTLALEILDDRPDVDTVYVPVGGGGLLGGVGRALRACRPDVRIVAVEPAGCPSLSAALEAGRPVDVACETICDGVAVPYVTDEMFPVLAALADDVLLIEEHEVRSAIRRLATRDRMVVEGAGALAVAAALREPPERRGLAVCLVTGGSLDVAKLVSILAEA